MSHLVIPYLLLAPIALVGLGLLVPLLFGEARIGSITSILGFALFIFAAGFVAHDYFGKVLPADRAIASICRASAERHQAKPPAYAVRDVYVKQGWDCGAACADYYLAQWNDLRIIMAKHDVVGSRNPTLSRHVSEIQEPVVEFSLAKLPTPGCFKPLEKRPEVCVRAIGKEAAEYDLSLQLSVRDWQQGGLLVNTREYVVHGRDNALLFFAETHRFRETSAYSSRFYYTDVFDSRYHCKGTPYFHEMSVMRTLLGPERQLTFE